MPNPMLLAAQPNRSRSQDVEREGIPPIPEKVAGPVFAYRGQQTHGVDPGKVWEAPVEDFKDEAEFIEAEPELPVVNVKVVNESVREECQFRIIRSVVPATGGCQQLLGPNRARTRVKIQVMDAANGAYISHENPTTSINGWHLDNFGTVNDSIDIQNGAAGSSIYGVSDAAAAVEIQILIEYATES